MISIIKSPPDAHILSVLLDDEIYDRMTDDLDPSKDTLGNADLSGYGVYAGYVDGQIASAFLVRKGLLHFYCLRKHRKHARELLQLSLEAHGQKVFCQIPVLYRETINFAKKAGFVKIGEKAKAWLKNGKLYGVEVLEWAA